MSLCSWPSGDLLAWNTWGNMGRWTWNIFGTSNKAIKVRQQCPPRLRPRCLGAKINFPIVYLPLVRLRPLCPHFSGAETNRQNSRQNSFHSNSWRATDDKRKFEYPAHNGPPFFKATKPYCMKAAPIYFSNISYKLKGLTAA